MAPAKFLSDVANIKKWRAAQMNIVCIKCGKLHSINDGLICAACKKKAVL